MHAIELGMLVFDETRMMSSNPEGLGQFENLVRRDRNHPSVFMWSMGNEEGQANTRRAWLILTAMKAVAQKHRRLAAGVHRTRGCHRNRRARRSCDVAGYNYMDPQAEEFHKKNPDKPVMGTETVSAVGTRGIYITDRSQGIREFVRSLHHDRTRIRRGLVEVLQRAAMAFRRIRVDGVRLSRRALALPVAQHQFAIRNHRHVRLSQRTPSTTTNPGGRTKPVLHLFPHWNWPGMEGKDIAVWVYSNLDQVELFHNGQSLGAKDVKKDSHVAWVVKYAPGSHRGPRLQRWQTGDTHQARDNRPAAETRAPRADRRKYTADGEDVAMFAVEVQDAQGRTVPITDNEVCSGFPGAGKLIGVGNGDPTDQRFRQGHIAQGVLRILHGVGAIVKECWDHSDRRSIARSHIGQRQHRCQGSETASAGGGVGTRGAVR